MIYFQQTMIWLDVRNLVEKISKIIENLPVQTWPKKLSKLKKRLIDAK